MKKDIGKTKYDLEFLEFVFSYLSNYKLLEIDITNMNNFSSKEKNVLTRLKEIYSKIKLFKDYQVVELEHFSDQEALFKANAFLIDLFPKKKEEILGLDDLISFGDYSIYDSGINYCFSGKKVIFNDILIPSDSTDYTSSIIVHEKIHALTFNNIDLISLFSNYLELFPMLIARMALDSIDNPFSDILDRVIRINDTKECFRSLEIANYLKNKKDKTIVDEYVYKYFILRSYDYLISELYSDLLFNYYLQDKDKMIKSLNKVFEQRISISEFLNIYNVNLLNKNLIPIIKEETNKCKRISIIP